MAAKPVEEEVPPAGEPLKCKTWVLKVLINCDGCKKKVKKVLTGIDGVYRTEVDSQQHKVTVTGNVDAETLIKKLLRSGKLAELWPEIPEKKDKKSEKSKGGDSNQKKEGQQKNSEPVGGGGGGSNEGSKDAAGEESNKEDQSDECEEGSGPGGGADGKKKKKNKNKNKNKGQNGGSASPDKGGKEISAVDAPLTADSATSMDSKDLTTSPPPPVQRGYPYPQMYYSPSPAYGFSYNTAYPNSSASYYAGVPLMPIHAYTTYTSRLPPPPPPPYDPIKHYGDGEDEYLGACSIM